MGGKFKSSQGAQEWLDFITLVTNTFALKEKQADELQVGLIMNSFALAANNLAHRYRQKDGLALMIFDSVTKSANVTVYNKDRYELAYEAYNQGGAT